MWSPSSALIGAYFNFLDLTRKIWAGESIAINDNVGLRIVINVGSLVFDPHVSDNGVEKVSLQS
jgi:hypothetical protein